MESISVFDMLKIGVGPSSSHTLGPWRAAERWIQELKSSNKFDKIDKVTVDLYGSLSLTGKGHATDYAVLLGLSGADPEYVPVSDIHSIVEHIQETKSLLLNNDSGIPLYSPNANEKLIDIKIKKITRDPIILLFIYFPLIYINMIISI